MTKIKSFFAKPTNVVIVALVAAVVVLLVAVAGLLGKDVILKRGSVGKEEAVSSAFADAGVAKEKAEIVYTEQELEDGVNVYEIEFIADGYKYEYMVRASDGAIIKKEMEMIKVVPEVPTVVNPTEEVTTDNGVGNSGNGYGPGYKQDDDDDDRPLNNGTTCVNPSTAYIGVGKAKNAAVAHAGLTNNKVTFLKAKLENDDGRYVYDVEFKKGFVEYDYTVDAVTGEILEFESEVDLPDIDD